MDLISIRLNEDTINEPIPVLNSGFVKYIDHMGNDNSIAQAARNSYAEGTKTVSTDHNLIRYLMRHKHYSPFAQCQIKLHFRLPIFVHNQFVRHDRVHWSMLSGRYSIMPEACWLSTEDNNFRIPSNTNKQAGDLSLDLLLQQRAQDIHSDSLLATRRAYNELLEMNICREQARTVLPMGIYTEGTATATLGDWLLILAQRLDSHAQYEIQVYAQAIAVIVRTLFPVTFQAFLDYQFNAITLSHREQLVLRELLGAIDEEKIVDLNKSEKREFLQKLNPDFLEI